MRLATVIFAAAGVVLLAPSSLLAQAPRLPQRQARDDPPEPCPYCGRSPSAPEGRRGLHWHAHWNRVGALEYVLTPALLGIGVAFNFLVRPAGDANWTGPALFDSPVRDAVAFDSDDARRAAQVTSDALLVGSVAHTMLVDPVLVAWAGRGSRDTAWQMLVINAQAYALTLSLNAITKRVVERERPWADRCAVEPDGEDCSSRARYVSFYSGHAAITATSAALVCAHHTQLKLYGSELADSLTCVGALTFTAATGVLRISSDNHWATDVLAGHLIGYASGYLIPTLRFYKEFRATPEPDDHARFTVLPWLGSSSFGAHLLGRL